MKKKHARIFIVFVLIITAVISRIISHEILYFLSVFFLGGTIITIMLSESNKILDWCMSKGVDVHGLNEQGGAPSSGKSIKKDRKTQ